MRATFFDFDGVLVDSEPLHEWAIHEAVAPLGWRVTHTQFIEGIVGRGDERAFVTIASWNKVDLPEGLASELLTTKRSKMAEGIAGGRFTVQPGAVDAVRAAAGLGPVAVCSGSRSSVVLPMLRAIGLADAFAHVITADDVARAKPAPDGYLLAASRLGLAPNLCTAIEDTPTGVQSARDAGMRVLAVCHTCPAEALASAHHVLARIADAIPLLRA
jgi:beta-phosphoglucomutase